MANRDYREVASEVVVRYLDVKEREKGLSSSEDYKNGYRDAVQMVLSVLRGKETLEVRNFYNFSRVFREDC
jgi:hypothetical protein